MNPGLAGGGRGGHALALGVAPQESFVSRVGHGVPETFRLLKSLAVRVRMEPSTVLRMAQLSGWALVQSNEDTKVLGFVRDDRAGERQRVNVYYTTMTVGTAVNHPRQGRTQLFRKRMDSYDLQKIFRDPRVHTGAGYYRRHALGQQAEPSPDRGATGIWACLDTQEDSDELLDGYCEGDDVMLGTSYFVVPRKGDPWWGGCPKGLDDKVRGRLNSHPDLPGVDYVSIGPSDAYFVQFSDGHCQWSGDSPASLDKELKIQAREPVDILAFAPGGGWFLQLEDGSFTYENLPKQLDNHLRGRGPSQLVEELTVGPDGEWFVRWASGDWRSSTCDSCRETMTKVESEGGDVTRVAFGEKGTWIIQHS